MPLFFLEETEALSPYLLLGLLAEKTFILVLQSTINQTNIILEVYILFLIMKLSIYHLFCLSLLVLVAFTAE